MAIVNLTEDTFNDIVVSHDIVLVDFWGPSCMPCLEFAPVYESMSEAHPEILFTKVNTEEQAGLVTRFNIQSVPTLVAFREKIIVFAEAGAKPPASLVTVIEHVSSLNMDDVRLQMAQQGQVQ